jgi:hypothetical protein
MEPSYQDMHRAELGSPDSVGQNLVSCQYQASSLGILVRIDRLGTGFATLSALSHEVSGSAQHWGGESTNVENVSADGGCSFSRIQSRADQRKNYENE